MDITLKQTEIEAAVRRYVVETIGVNLTGKRLGIQFSATRGAAGIVASLSIEDASDVIIPGFTDRDADSIITTLEVPKASATITTLELKTPTPNTVGAAIAEAPVKAIVNDESAVEAVKETEVVKAAVPEEVVEGAAPAAASGLFGDD